MKKIDLVHAFGGGSENYSLEVVPFLDRRVVITEKTTEDFRKQYEKAGIDSSYLDRVVLIENAVDVSTVFPKKNRLGNLTVLYVGRGSEEKRVHLVGKAAALCAAKGLPVQFVLVGDVKASIAAEDRKWCVFKGEISNPLEMKVLYDSADILVLVSKREGFPMAIMEAMAHAVVPVVTPVGGIPSHVRNGSNGVFLAEAAEEIPSSIVATLSGFCSSPESLDRMSRQAYEEAVASFSRTRFCRSYRELLEC